MNTVLSVSYAGDTAMPIRPPSPPGTASPIVCTVVTASPSDVDSLPTFSSFLLSRSVTNAEPSGRNAIAHGTARPLASTFVVTCVWPPSSPLPEVDALGYGDSFGGEPSSSGGGGPNEQPARASIATAA